MSVDLTCNLIEDLTHPPAFRAGGGFGSPNVMDNFDFARDAFRLGAKWRNHRRSRQTFSVVSGVGVVVIKAISYEWVCKCWE